MRIAQTHYERDAIAERRLRALIGGAGLVAILFFLLASSLLAGQI